MSRDNHFKSKTPQEIIQSKNHFRQAQVRDEEKQRRVIESHHFSIREIVYPDIIKTTRPTDHQTDTMKLPLATRRLPTPKVQNHPFIPVRSAQKRVAMCSFHPITALGQSSLRCLVHNAKLPAEQRSKLRTHNPLFLLRRSSTLLCI
jgi:hypothetical protein